MPSALSRLRERVAKARNANWLDLRPPSDALDGVYVRCRALNPEELSRALERHKGDDKAGVEQAIDVLVATCVGVWEEVDGKGVSVVEGFDGRIDDLVTGELKGSLPTFSDPALAEALGVQDGTAAAACRALLAPVSDLQLMRYADAVADFSTSANARVMRETAGK